MKKSVVQEWVSDLGLRHQGVLLTAIRGCDTVEKHDPVKMLARVFRAMILHCHCGDPRVAVSFIELPENDVIQARMLAVIRSHDQYPLHYIMHLIHAAEILGYYHPNTIYRNLWNAFYLAMVHKFHMFPETKEALDARLDANEEAFKAAQ